MQYKVLFKPTRMENKEVINTLSEIRDMMAKSSKFMSLSGLSCAIVGAFALIACFIAQYILDNPAWEHHRKVFTLTVLASVLLIICIATAFLFARRKAKKNNYRFTLDKTAQRMLWSFILPLLTGGILCIGLIHQGHYGLTSSFMLIFYGLSLTNISGYTFSSTKYLGYALLILGIIDFMVVNQSLLFWALGFGVCHIVYGILFYLLKERKSER